MGNCITGCSVCDRPYTVTAFASLSSRVCLECEGKIITECKGCKKLKPITEFALCHTMKTGRESRCKACKCKKIRPQKNCSGCGIEISGATNTRYCQECSRKRKEIKPVYQEKKERAIDRHVLIVHRLLSTAWRATR